MEYTKDNHLSNYFNNKIIIEIPEDLVKDENSNYYIDRNVGRYKLTVTNKKDLEPVTVIAPDTNTYWIRKIEFDYIEKNISLDSIQRLRYVIGLVDPINLKLPIESYCPIDGYELHIFTDERYNTKKNNILTQIPQ